MLLVALVVGQMTLLPQEAKLNELIEHLTAIHQLQMSEKEQHYKLKECRRAYLSMWTR